MSHTPGIMSGGEVNWCPSGKAYLPYCPSPGYPDSYKYCCSYFYLGVEKPSCCRFPIHTGLLISLIVSLIPLTILFVFLYCWCWPNSRWNRYRQLQRRSDV